ncbi:hypothetical protein [Mastigocoleus sp. MO_188.B34]|uniref:hypothetical protein n=1 Tax=Mastigocoleus sp. MO_188.B34 TaxID=3036635 RepID=UPI002636787A|nr:hypothetical protein [Mastigocoleus sp. MO_188.B34]MDJ0694652.1 hypothetical protein [Mastigocoleus sp. MO_188.B34]
MYRLNKQAYNILIEEVQRCAAKDEIGKTEKQIVVKRLTKMRLQKGEPAKLDELRDTIFDVYPQFSEKVLKQAAALNQPPNGFNKFINQTIWIAALISIPAGILWVINLPYPMIRKPVAQKAPILLFPSFWTMDRSYRGAINSLKQAEQLLNKSTSTADIERGSKKVKQAQKHLNNLPVWFLGYYPQTYCTMFGCVWKFTFDEFKVARERAARLEAIAFQDTNALKPLKAVEESIKEAKKQYQQAKNISDREKAIAKWQISINQLNLIPQQTLAGKTAKAKLKVYQQDFQNAVVSSFISAAEEFNTEAEKITATQPQVAAELLKQAVTHLNKVPTDNPRYLEAQKLSAIYQVKTKTLANSNGGNYIKAAKGFAIAAAKASQNPPHRAETWGEIAKLWQKAIEKLEKIQVREPSYSEAQNLLATYQTNLGTIKTRQKLEIEAQQKLQQAHRQIQNLIANPGSNPQQFKAQIQGVINQLKTISAGTTAYKEAEQLLKSAYDKLKQT